MDQQQEQAAAEAAATVFTALPAGGEVLFGDKDILSYLLKWGMEKHMKLAKFRYNKPFHKKAPEPFLRDFFSDKAVMATFQVCTPNGEWVAVGDSGIVAANAVRWEAVPASWTSMAPFDRLIEAGVVRESGSISKCMDDCINGFPVSDLLRHMLLSEESEHADLFSADERSELLFRIFKHLCLGGAMCQFEDDIQPYLDTTRQVYKELVSVQKNATSGQVEVVSQAYAVTAVDLPNWSLFPRKSPQNFCYFAVDPIKRQLAVWYHAYVPYW
eukprot:jgi/Chlat1/4592/Chrsp290S04343